MNLQLPKTSTVITMDGLDLRHNIQAFVLERTKQYAEQDVLYRESGHCITDGMPRYVLDSITTEILGDEHSNGSYSYLSDEGFYGTYWNSSFVVRDHNDLTFSAIEKDDFIDGDENLTRSGVFYVVKLSEYDYDQPRPQRVTRQYHIPVEVLLELQKELYKIEDEIVLMWSW